MSLGVSDITYNGAMFTFGTYTDLVDTEFKEYIIILTKDGQLAHY